MSHITFFLTGDPDCTNYGQCIRDTATNSSICVCDAGFTGDDCSEFVCPGPVNNTCNGNGMTFVGDVFYVWYLHMIIET